MGYTTPHCRLSLHLPLLFLTVVFATSGASGRTSGRFLYQNQDPLRKIGGDEWETNKIPDDFFKATNYKSKPKFNRMLFELKKGKHARNHRGKHTWDTNWDKPRRNQQTLSGNAFYHLQDLTHKDIKNGHLPEAVRMTPNRVDNLKSKKAHKRRNNKIHKKALKAKMARHKNILKSLGKNYNDKAVWKYMNQRAKDEHRKNNAP